MKKSSKKKKISGFVTKQVIYMPRRHKLVETWGYFKNLKEIGEFLPGIFLAKDTKTQEYFLVGGQGKPGDDILRFKKTDILFDPYRPYTDKQIDSFPSNHKVVKNYSKYLEKLCTFESKLRWNLDQSISFYESCVEAGYKKEMNGSRIGPWIIDRLQDLLKAKRKQL